MTIVTFDTLEERLATKQDIENLQHEIKELELRLKHDLTVRMGAMAAAIIAILAAIIKLS